MVKPLRRLMLDPQTPGDRDQAGWDTGANVCIIPYCIGRIIHNNANSIKAIMMRNYHFVLLFLLVCVPLTVMAAPPPPPAGLCVQTQGSVTTCGVDEQKPVATNPDGQAGVFPGTNLRFYPGFVVWATENESLSEIESRWQALFSTSQNRKASYRPAGIYGGIYSHMAWRRYYTDPKVRPANPRDHNDPAYDWRNLDAIFSLNAVQNDGALVVIRIDDIGWRLSRRAPDWIANSPFNGVFFTFGTDSRETPKYYRSDIVKEYADFHRALHDHLVSTGNIDKVMYLEVTEMFVAANAVTPLDYSFTDFSHGVGSRNKLVAKIWEESQIHVNVNSFVGPSRNILWGYLNNPIVGMSFPDMKMSGTDNISGADRFSSPDGTNQKDKRPLVQILEANGHRANTHFAANIPNPWGYSNESRPQTPSHILWALSGPPKGVNKDSGLGRPGDDPPGVMPVHTVVMDWGRAWQEHSPSLEEWHVAIDTFGPPGTFAFPYLPKGYGLGVD